jgi:hypothetical protein
VVSDSRAACSRSWRAACGVTDSSPSPDVTRYRSPSSRGNLIGRVTPTCACPMAGGPQSVLRHAARFPRATDSEPGGQRHEREQRALTVVDSRLRAVQSTRERGRTTGFSSAWDGQKLDASAGPSRCSTMRSGSSWRTRLVMWLRGASTVAPKCRCISCASAPRRPAFSTAPGEPVSVLVSLRGRSPLMHRGDASVCAIDRA